MPRLTADRPLAISNQPSNATIGLAPLTEAMIREQTDDNSFTRGRAYARAGRIFRTIRRDRTLQARCHGSSGGPYRVQATLAAADDTARHPLIAVRCDCPRGGFCKHIVALLLTWIEAPDTFEVHPSVAELLADKTREELVTLIELMLDADPDLDLVLRLPAPGKGVPSDAPVDEAALRRQITTALDELGYTRHGESSYYYDEYLESNPAASVISEALQRLTSLGEAYLTSGQARNALSVYATLVEQVAPEMESLDDYGYAGEDERPPLLAACDRGLAALLESQAMQPADPLTTEERDRLIEALYTLWFTELEVDGMEFAHDGQEAIARFSTSEERRKVGAMLRQLIVPGGGDTWARDAVNRAAIHFLSLLGPDGGLTDDELLAEYRKAELWEEAADLLLRTHRVEEAIALAGRRLTTSMSLLRFANQLIATRDDSRIEQAISLVDGCLWEREGHNVRDDHALSEWLEQEYAAQGRPGKALELARRRFQQAPSRRTYEAVMEKALLPRQTGPAWAALRPDLLAELRKRHDWYALINIHLEAGEITEALAAYTQTQQRRSPGVFGFGYSDNSYAERVAAAVAPTLPDEALAIYQRLANDQIEQRKRPAYQEAARYLGEVMKLLEGNGRSTEWTTLISDLRQEHKKLRALREELDALGLN